MARSDRKRIAVVALFACAVPLVVACNGIIGLSDFEKGECAGRRCAEAGVPIEGGGPDVFTDAPLEARGSNAVSWAQWAMPNYDGGTDFLPHPLKYTLLDDNRIKDEVTSLVWRRATLPGEQKSLDDAKRACALLDPTTGPWRLPKRIELVTLLDFGRLAPLIDPQFTGVKNVRVWSSSELRPFVTTPTAFWTVDFKSGVVDTQTATSNDVLNVLCVGAK